MKSRQGLLWPYRISFCARTALSRGQTAVSSYERHVASLSLSRNVSYVQQNTRARRVTQVTKLSIDNINSVGLEVTADVFPLYLHDAIVRP